jgi:hypothetical protein
VFWGPDDWDSLTPIHNELSVTRPAQAEALEQALLRIPDPERKVVASIGFANRMMVPLLKRRFARVRTVDQSPAAFRNRFHVAVALASLPSASRGVDRFLHEVYGSLVEGGLFLGTVPAADRSGEPIRLTLSGESPEEDRPAYHEIELQYRLRRAGFQGIRIRRVEGIYDDPDNRPFLVCVAARRAFN